MALLVENSAVIMAKGRRNSSAEVRKLEMFLFHFIWLKVLYAAGWLVGEFCEHLTSPVETLQAMLRALSSSLPHHIQVWQSNLSASVKVYLPRKQTLGQMEKSVCRYKFFQAVFIQNSLKLWAAHCLDHEEVCCPLKDQSSTLGFSKSSCGFEHSKNRWKESWCYFWSCSLEVKRWRWAPIESDFLLNTTN